MGEMSLGPPIPFGRKQHSHQILDRVSYLATLIAKFLTHYERDNLPPPTKIYEERKIKIPFELVWLLAPTNSCIG